MAEGPSRADLNQPIIAEFRANAGKVGGPFAGITLVLLTTTGAKSGVRRTNPLAALRDDDRLLVFGTNGGRPTHPGWYHNVLATPEVSVETGTETYEATAVPLHGDERDRMWARQVGAVPTFADYEASTPRVIPVVALYRRTT